jgi:hypothetical protein
MAASLGIISDKARFHLLTVLTGGNHLLKYESDATKVEICARTSGHVLRVREKEIVCERCPAVWKDEGF